MNGGGWLISLNRFDSDAIGIVGSWQWVLCRQYNRNRKVVFVPFKLQIWLSYGTCPVYLCAKIMDTVWGHQLQDLQPQPIITPEEIISPEFG